MTEAQLIERAAAGDEAAIRTLYDRYSARVFAVVRRISGDEELARDYAQEAWIRAIRGLSSYRGEARFSTWIHRIAVNTVLQASRETRRREAREIPQDPLRLPGFPPVDPPPFDPPDVFLERRLESALDRLPQGMRTVLVLHDVEGYTHAEIGGLLGVAAGTSKSQLFKARARMRHYLTQITASLSVPGQSEGAEE